MVAVAGMVCLWLKKEPLRVPQNLSMKWAFQMPWESKISHSAQASLEMLRQASASRSSRLPSLESRQCWCQTPLESAQALLRRHAKRAGIVIVRVSVEAVKAVWFELPP